jgi:hypothetical protein
MCLTVSVAGIYMSACLKEYEWSNFVFLVENILIGIIILAYYIKKEKNKC